MSKKKKKRLTLEQRRKRRIIKRVVLAVIAVLVVCGGAAGYLYHRHLQQVAEEQAAAEQAALEAGYAEEVASVKAVYQTWSDTVETDTIYTGISAMGVDLSGMTEEEAEEALSDAYADAVLSKTITLTYEDETWVYTYEDLGYTADTASLAAEAYAVYRTGSIRERYEKVVALAENPIDLLLTDEYDDTTIDTILAEIAEEIDVEAVDAELTMTGSTTFTISSETVGYEVDIEATKAAIQELLVTEEDIEIEITVDEIIPDKTEEALSTIGDVLGTYSTSYSTSSSSSNRNTNLAVGCEHITGTVLMPGESFNFNDTVSPVTEDEGYKESSTILDGEYVSGIGGGLCQVCTTLYNAVIRAELEVTERYPHSLMQSYVPGGLDAAMSIGGKNLQFTNTLDYPILIVMSASGGKLSCTIYGYETRDESRTVTFESVLVETISKPDDVITYDDTMYEDEEEVTSTGQVGYKYEVYKVVTENGETTRTLFTTSTYSAVADQVTVGTKKRSSSSSDSSDSSDSSEEEEEDSSEEEEDSSEEEDTEEESSTESEDSTEDTEE